MFFWVLTMLFHLVGTSHLIDKVIKLFKWLLLTKIRPAHRMCSIRKKETKKNQFAIDNRMSQMKPIKFLMRHFN